jgi:hypothetical protein
MDESKRVCLSRKRSLFNPPLLALLLRSDHSCDWSFTALVMPH